MVDSSLPPLPWTVHRRDSLVTVYDANDRVILLLNGPGAGELAELFRRSPGVVAERDALRKRLVAAHGLLCTPENCRFDGEETDHDEYFAALAKGVAP